MTFSRFFIRKENVMRKGIGVAGLVVLLGGGAAVAQKAPEKKAAAAPATTGQGGGAPQMDAQTQAMMAEMQKLGTPGAEHKALSPLVGSFTTVARFWMGGPKPMESAGSVEAKWVYPVPMRTSVASSAVVLGLVLLPGAGVAAPPSQRDLVAVLPPSVAEPELAESALLLQARAVQLLAAAGSPEIHVKQILRMADHEGLALGAIAAPEAALAAGRHVGARRTVYGRLAREGGTLVLEAQVAVAGGARASVGAKSRTVLPAGLAAAVDEGGRALARLVAEPDGVTLPSPPRWTASDGAMGKYGGCAAILLRQPIGIENPTVLQASDIGRAVRLCRAAVESDPNFVEAWAALGLAQAIAGEDADAVRSLLKVKDRGASTPLFWLGRYWLLTRYESVEAGLFCLQQAVKERPGFLLARGYIAEHLAAARTWEAALEAWRAYLAAAPSSAFVRGRMSSVLGHLGRHDEAIAAAKEALAADPTSKSAVVELASRYIDAKRYDDAIAALEPLARARDATAETLVRLAYAHLEKGALDKAEALLLQARERATKPEEWRTRGRIFADLARVYLKRGQEALATEQVRAAKRDDLVAVLLAQNDAQLTRLTNETSRRPATAPAVPGPRFVKPQELSPFSISPAGDVDARTRPYGAPPPSIELLRF
jgi:tetratricopeptide (TPR) repeat protein